ncbi:MAG: DUF1848 domain-containing protein [Ruminiclostridium sp.]
MILSASRRTDIPCYYSDWFMNRINAGYVLNRNPINHAQISKIPLSPDVVDCIVFWTKDARNIIDKLNVLDSLGYNYYFQFTLTPYNKSIEKGLRDKADIEDTFITLSKTIGKSRVLWRYDPIVVNDTLNISYHKKQFTRMCEKLCDHTESVTISFVDIYPKLKSQLIREISEDEMAELSTFIGEKANAYGLTAKACCEKTDLSRYGIAKATCIDKDVIERIYSTYLNIKPDKNQRDSCGCYESIDIGAYNTCKNGCIYCYASNSELSIKNNCNKYNPTSELLIGEVLDGEKVIDRKVNSNKITQFGLFDL